MEFLSDIWVGLSADLGNTALIAGTIFAVFIGTYNAVVARSLHKLNEQKERVAAFRARKKEQRRALGSKFSLIENAVEAVQDLVSIGAGAAFNNIIKKAIAAMTAIQAAPDETDLDIAQWVRGPHQGELINLRQALAAIVLDVSRSPVRRAEPAYKQRMKCYAYILNLTSKRLSFLAAVYKLRRRVEDVGPVLAIQLVLDGAAPDAIIAFIEQPANCSRWRQDGSAGNIL